MKYLQSALRHIVHYRYVYLIALFLLVAGLTCGIRTGHAVDTDSLDGISVCPSFFKVLWLLIKELLCVLILFPAQFCPAGCALSAALMLGKGFSVGYCWGWWCIRWGGKGIIPFLLGILPQGLLSLGVYAWLCVVTGCAALRICRFTPRETLRNFVFAAALQTIAVLLRCISCAWMA